MTQKQTRRRYSEEFKARAVELVESQGGRVSETARQLGIDRSMLDRWRRERSTAAGGGSNAPVIDERDLELRRLQAENRRLREERTVLKKAAAFFANESS